MTDLWKAQEEANLILRQAIEATKRRDAAVAEGRPAAEIERLSEEVEALEKAFHDYLQQAFGRDGASLH